MSKTPQPRAEETKRKILKAAGTLFSERGFERTQLDEVAVLAGCSRGAIYAHFENKEAVFLALFRETLVRRFKNVYQELIGEINVSKRMGIYKRFSLSMMSELQTSNLAIQYKLHAIQNAGAHRRLYEHYQGLFLEVCGPDLASVLLGEDAPAARRAEINLRLALFAGAASGLGVERNFHKGVVPQALMDQCMEELFDTLLLRPARKKIASTPAAARRQARKRT